MSDLCLAFEVDEQAGSFFFRFPADDEAALWVGPFDTRAQAEAEALVSVESFIAAGVLAELGLSN